MGQKIEWQSGSDGVGGDDDDDDNATVDPIDRLKKK